MDPMFDHERLEVYQLELEFIAWATPLVSEVAQVKDVKTSDIIDHLDRASISALFNTAEGNGKRQRQVRARYFDDARGSATECAASLDALVARGATTPARVADGKRMLRRVYQMLTKLVQLFEGSDRVREEEVGYGIALTGEDGRRMLEEEEEEIEDEDE